MVRDMLYQISWDGRGVGGYFVFLFVCVGRFVHMWLWTLVILQESAGVGVFVCKFVIVCKFYVYMFSVFVWMYEYMMNVPSFPFLCMFVQ